MNQENILDSITPTNLENIFHNKVDLHEFYRNH